MTRAKALRWLGALLFGVLVTCAASSPSRADGSANFFLGQKSLDKSDWTPVEKQPEFGAEISFGRQGWPIQIAIDVLASSKETDISGITVKGSTSEIDAGIRKTWVAGKARPYIGGGLAQVYTRFEGTQSGITVTDDDRVLGYWLGAGIFWRLGRSFNIGASARYSKATATMFGIDGEAGGSHFGALLGWSWPVNK